MIIRILGEGQYEVDASLSSELDALDRELAAALDSGDEKRFSSALDGLKSVVRSKGRALEVTDLVPSDLTLPDSDATLEEVRSLLSSEPTEGN